MKALGDQCWVNTAINFGTCCKWRLNEVDDGILCSTWQEYRRYYVYIHNRFQTPLLMLLYIYSILLKEIIIIIIKWIDE